MFINFHHKTAFAVTAHVPIMAVIRGLIGLSADHNSDGVLVTSIERAGLAIPVIESAANERGSDIVLGAFVAEDMSAAPPLFAIGVRLHWKYLWHTQFHLWLPRTGEPAVFVPATPQADPCFRIEEGRLFADQRMPFASMIDRKRGILAAHAVLCSSVEG